MMAADRLARSIALVFWLLVMSTGVGRAQDTIGTTFPAGFPVIEDASLGVPVIGFGAAGSATATPVIFLHGNGGTPYDTSCGMWPTLIRSMAQYFANAGYSRSELWALGYQGTQCDLINNPANNSGLAHTNTANVPDLRRFVNAVLVSTGAQKLVREWVRQYGAQKLVRRFVAIEGPNSGMITCSPSPSNYWRLAFSGGFTPTSPVCQELGSPNTLFLKVLNKASNRIDPKNTLVIRNGDASFLFLPVQDGLLAPVPAMDSFGKPANFSTSPRISRAAELVVTGRGAYDVFQGTAHLGIANSPQTWQAALSFLSRP